MRKTQNTRTRLVDIASAVGVSVNTVSLALRDSKRVRADTKAQIQAVARKLNYRPNELAKSLVNRASKTVGLVITDINNPLITQVAKSVEKQLSAHGYMTLLAASDNDCKEEVKILETFRSRMVDGILIFPVQHDATEALELFAHELPIVSMSLGQSDDLDMVGIDEKKGAFLATEHLISGGHRFIAFVDSALKIGNIAKQEGYIAALKAAEIKVDEGLIIYPERHALRSGYQAADKLLKGSQKPSAIFCANDSLALGVLKYCLDHQISVPKDLSVMGFDNVPYGEFAHVPLTTVDTNAKEVAKRAISRLLHRISANNDCLNEKVAIAPELVLRSSTSSF